MMMTYCIGLTGNVASGKSTVATMFKTLDVPIISADAIAKDISRPNESAYKEILAHFGTSILQEDGQLNRRALRGLIFSNQEERLWLENLLHPLIRNRIQEEVRHCKALYCMIEIPLLYDVSLYPYLNRVLLISAPIESQIQRLMDRDACTQESALAVLSLQPNEESRKAIADDILCNDDSLEELQKKIQNLHNKYLQEAKKYGKMSDKQSGNN